jgi:thiol-disulfide isomerase/thioredoxin
MSRHINLNSFKISFLLVFIMMTQFVSAKKLKEGSYRGVLYLNQEKNIELPFNFDVKYKSSKPVIIVKNGDERIEIDDIKIKGDSVNFKMPVFDTEFKTIFEGDNLIGFWINNYKTVNNKIKFKAFFGSTERFSFLPSTSKSVLEGRWETTFSPNSTDSSKAIGIFHHIEQTDFLTGTFLTETGDYRFLEGIKHDNNIYLSCFDGSHAFLFVAEIDSNEIINGMFYSGSSWQEPWTAKRNEQFKLNDAESVTFLKNKNEKINFYFPDLEKKMVSLSDKKFENKVIILQIMGSWCPNCMDESAYLSGIYNQYNNQGLEIIALAFEKTTDFDQSKKQLLRLKNKFNMQYDILITQQSGKENASKTFNSLNKISAFPTTIFLNKQHQVVKIHTGFNGPATGIEYELFKNNTEKFLNKLLQD